MYAWPQGLYMYVEILVHMESFPARLPKASLRQDRAKGKNFKGKVIYGTLKFDIIHGNRFYKRLTDTHVVTLAQLSSIAQSTKQHYKWSRHMVDW